jgi:hypothetical protein
MLQSSDMTVSTKSSFAYNDLKHNSNPSELSANLSIYFLKVHYNLTILVKSGDQAISICTEDGAREHATRGKYEICACSLSRLEMRQTVAPQKKVLTLRFFELLLLVSIVRIARDNGGHDGHHHRQYEAHVGPHHPRLAR